MILAPVLLQWFKSFFSILCSRYMITLTRFDNIIFRKRGCPLPHDHVRHFIFWQYQKHLSAQHLNARQHQHGHLSVSMAPGAAVGSKKSTCQISGLHKAVKDRQQGGNPIIKGFIRVAEVSVSSWDALVKIRCLENQNRLLLKPSFQIKVFHGNSPRRHHTANFFLYTRTWKFIWKCESIKRQRVCLCCLVAISSSFSHFVNDLAVFPFPVLPDSLNSSQGFSQVLEAQLSNYITGELFWDRNNSSPMAVQYIWGYGWNGDWITVHLLLPPLHIKTHTFPTTMHSQNVNKVISFVICSLCKIWKGGGGEKRVAYIYPWTIE